MCVGTQALDVCWHTGTGCVWAHRHRMCVGTQAQEESPAYRVGRVSNN